MSLDPIHRQWEHHLLTFSLMYAFSENFVLPLSHDEVVHGKKSLVDKMPGDYWQKFANLRAFYGYWMAHPGKKLLFMGGEFGQFIEWNEAQSLDWHLLGYELHGKLKGYVQNLNHLYRQQAALWQLDHDWQGFQWIDCHDYSQSVISFLRTDDQGNFIIVITNFTPIVRYNYRVGVPKAGRYREIMNSDAECYGGSGQINGELLAQPTEWHSQPCSLELKLPPLASIYLQWEADVASD
jgi:1,4-alpha-glucan branching enzyme